MWKVSLKTQPNKTYVLMTCRLFVLWTLNRQAKIFLRTAYWIMKISWKYHTGVWGKNISRKVLQCQDGKELFRKTKKNLHKYKISITFTTLLIVSSICFFECYKDKNTKLHSFFCSTNHSGDSHGSISSSSNISFQLGQTWSCLKYLLNISH